MKKWKKKILKAIYKQWRKEYISAQEIVMWLNDPKSTTEIYQWMLDYDSSGYRRFCINLKALIFRWKTES